MIRLAMLSMVSALTFVGNEQLKPDQHSGGYVCEGNCANPGQCARAYVDGWFPGSSHNRFTAILGWLRKVHTPRAP